MEQTTKTKKPEPKKIMRCIDCGKVGDDLQNICTHNDEEDDEGFPKETYYQMVDVNGFLCGGNCGTEFIFSKPLGKGCFRCTICKRETLFVCNRELVNGHRKVSAHKLAVDPLDYSGVPRKHSQLLGDQACILFIPSKNCFRCGCAHTDNDLFCYDCRPADNKVPSIQHSEHETGCLCSMCQEGIYPGENLYVRCLLCGWHPYINRTPLHHKSHVKCLFSLLDVRCPNLECDMFCTWMFNIGPFLFKCIKCGCKISATVDDSGAQMSVFEKASQSIPKKPMKNLGSLTYTSLEDNQEKTIAITMDDNSDESDDEKSEQVVPMDVTSEN